MWQTTLRELQSKKDKMAFSTIHTKMKIQSNLEDQSIVLRLSLEDLGKMYDKNEVLLF